MRPRHGFSLFEMLLVLALLAVTAAVVWPALEGLYGDSQLRSGADLVRARLTGARLDAMEEGVVYHFRYAPGERYYQVSPSTGAGDEQGTTLGVVETVFTLPLGLRFFAEPSEVMATGTVSAPTSQGGIGASDAGVQASQVPAGLAWSDPVVFRPDGTADDAQLVVAGEDGSYVQLRLRSVTGVVSASAPQGRQ